MVEELEQGLQNYARVYNSKLKLMSARWRAAGAAGGMGIAAAVFLNADIKPGIEIGVECGQSCAGSAGRSTGDYRGRAHRLGKRQAVKRRWVWRRWRSSLMYR
ncbi:glycerate kinase II [Escherichia coli]|uniref:Glycerate kinase II n=1 Tax=Escherichia coli TaxID=562 RepID=A0A376YCT6_ECOLX|nr:glycerate kinase II [Escherichia coli]